VAYDASSGAQLWARSYNGPGNAFDSALGIAANPDGSKVYVTGWSERSVVDTDYATIAYDASTGSRLWLRRYNGPLNGSDTAYAIAVTPDGAAVVVTGQSDLPSGFCRQNGCNYATVAYSATTGAQRWVKRYNGPDQSEDAALAVTISPDSSKVFVTGFSYGLSSSYDYATVAYGIQAGAQLWVSRYNGPANEWDYGFSVAVSPDGSKVFVTGASSAGTEDYDEDYATVAYSTT
jgi:DNA-binding beta-propeller fold protein YncE